MKWESGRGGPQAGLEPPWPRSPHRDLSPSCHFASPRTPPPLLSLPFAPSINVFICGSQFSHAHHQKAHPIQRPAPPPGPHTPLSLSRAFFLMYYELALIVLNTAPRNMFKFFVKFRRRYSRRKKNLASAICPGGASDARNPPSSATPPTLATQTDPSGL